MAPQLRRLRIRYRFYPAGTTHRFLMHGDDFVVDLGGDHSVRALLGVEEEEAGISNSGTPVLTMHGTYRTPAEWIDVLDGIAREQWPQSFVPGTPNDFLFDHYPTGLQTLCTDAIDELIGGAVRVLGLLRWRLGSSALGGQGRPAGGHGPEWSINGRSWFRLRTLPQFTASIVDDMELSPRREAAVRDVARDSASAEPLGWELWHVVRGLGDARAQIVTAVSAVEIELKRLIGHLAPYAAPLAVNTPTPPLRKIIREYLPQLPEIEPKYLPSTRLIDILRLAVEARNVLVHQGRAVDEIAQMLGKYTLEDVLRATADLLWLFDAQRSHTWALDHISEETRAELVGAPAAPEPEPEGKLSIEEVADRLGVAVSTVRRHRGTPDYAFPPPNGMDGRSPWWWLTRIDKWALERSARAKTT